jgi:hypothetical protein
MDLDLFERLLYEEESETLDFKAQQYPFDGATDDQKSELLKDILAFANAWRRTDAYILIGVEEVRAGRSIVRGVATQLLNQNLQQFAASKTNRPVLFSYTPLMFKGLAVGVITIPLQERPVYLQKRYGKVIPQVVYIRRGDTTAQASPDEIARMGRAFASEGTAPTLELDLYDPGGRNKLGKSVELTVPAFEVPEEESIPDFGRPADPIFGTSSQILNNPDFYRELATYFRDTACLVPLGLAVTNSSATVARGALLTLEFDATSGILMLDDSEKPAIPSRERIVGPTRASIPARDRAIEVCHHGNIIEARMELAAVQPGVTAWSSNVVHVGAQKNAFVRPRVNISAHNLPSPLSFEIAISVRAEIRRIGLKELCSAPSKRRPRRQPT